MRYARRTMPHGHLPPETVASILAGYQEWKQGLDADEMDKLDLCEHRLVSSIYNFGAASAAELMVQLLLGVRNERMLRGRN